MNRLKWDERDTFADLMPSHSFGSLWLGPKTMEIRRQSDEQAAKIMKCTVDELLAEQERCLAAAWNRQKEQLTPVGA